ncbi:TPA: DNA gyrase inhibitor YacG [Neisseria bacilliformis]|uniref:DNA gyrase inhibitor YacG n=1 Tax=Neisseria bacilliformis TaxID=267212 RepID=UPI0006692F09|nr:DNA gyrase inhibitor YacG [Neisseria bacilliformis]
MNQPAPTVKCPRCGKPAEFSPRNPYRPFCSQRCKTNDLGAWADGSYRVSAEEEPFSEPPTH